MVAGFLDYGTDRLPTSYWIEDDHRPEDRRYNHRHARLTARLANMGMLCC